MQTKDDPFKELPSNTLSWASQFRQKKGPSLCGQIPTEPTLDGFLPSAQSITKWVHSKSASTPHRLDPRPMRVRAYRGDKQVVKNA
jgi:hypothetical protein